MPARFRRPVRAVADVVVAGAIIIEARQKRSRADVAGPAQLHWVVVSVPARTVQRRASRVISRGQLASVAVMKTWPWA